MEGSDARRPIADRVHDEVLGRILASRLRAGDRVSVDALARELDVSQTPIREALNRLVADGTVVRHHLSGYRVAPKLTRERFEDLVEVRLLLEPAAARAAAERVDRAGLERIRGLADELREHAASGGETAFALVSRADARFHDAVAEGGGNTFVRDALARLHTHAHLFRLASDARITTDAIVEHAAIVDAIARRELDAAAYEMRRHIELSAERFRAGFAGG